MNYPSIDIAFNNRLMYYDIERLKKITNYSSLTSTIRIQKYVVE